MVSHGCGLATSLLSLPFGAACRLERDGAARFVSYHFIDKPELTGQFNDAMEAIKLLTET
jgi:hypothetical protein